jgi:ABC-type multidrug transport system ATPase subunit
MLKIESDSLLINFEHRLSRDFKIFANNIQIKKNAITGIIGKNGSGKTSFIKFLAFNKINNDKHNTFSFIEQIPIELTHLTCAEILSFLNKGLKSIMSLERLGEACGFDLIKDQKINSLSTGESRRLLNFLSLSKANKVILLDEPFNGLDKEFEKKIIDYLANEKSTVLIAAHQAEILLNLSEHLLILDDGIVQNISETEKDGVFTQPSYVLSFNSRITQDNCMKYLGERNGDHEYSFFSQASSCGPEKEMKKILKIIGSNSKNFKEMKKVDGEFFYKNGEIN